MTNPRLLIAGVPAAGKTHFGRWLSATHGFVHVDIEDHECVRSLGLADVVAPFVERGDAERLLDALESLDRAVVFDWGFPPNCLHIVEAFQGCGFELWWLDADRRQAREKFIKRDTVAVKYYDIQITAIDRTWNAIADLFAPNIVEVLNAAGVRMDPEEIWRRIQHAV